MNSSIARKQNQQSVQRSMNRVGTWLMIGAIALVATLPAVAQNSALNEKLASVKQSMAQNAQRLHQYQWTETTQLTVKGDPKPASLNVCHYGPDGQVQKLPLGPPPE